MMDGHVAIIDLLMNDDVIRCNLALYQSASYRAFSDIWSQKNKLKTKTGIGT